MVFGSTTSGRLPYRTAAAPVSRVCRPSIAAIGAVSAMFRACPDNSADHSANGGSDWTTYDGSCNRSGADTDGRSALGRCRRREQHECGQDSKCSDGIAHVTAPCFWSFDQTQGELHGSSTWNFRSRFGVTIRRHYVDASLGTPTFNAARQEAERYQVPAGGFAEILSKTCAYPDMSGTRLKLRET